MLTLKLLIEPESMFFKINRPFRYIQFVISWSSNRILLCMIKCAVLHASCIVSQCDRSYKKEYTAEHMLGILIDSLKHNQKWLAKTYCSQKLPINFDLTPLNKNSKFIRFLKLIPHVSCLLDALDVARPHYSAI